MSIVTVRPDATVATGGSSFTGAASRHAAVNGSGGDSDSSYITLEGHGTCILGLPDPTIPGSTVVGAISVRVRIGQVFGFFSGAPSLKAMVNSNGISNTVPVIWTSPTTLQIVAGAYSTTPTDMELELTLLGGDGLVPTKIKVFEVWVDTVYYEKPVTSNVDVSSGTTFPNAVWDSTLDILPIDQYFQAKVFTDAQYGIGGFNPSSSPNYFNSGILNLGPYGKNKGEPGFTTNPQPGDYSQPRQWISEGTVLPNDTYRTYIRTGRLVNGTVWWSDWAYDEYTINFTPPSAPSASATGDAAHGRNVIATGKGSSQFTQTQYSYDDGVTWTDFPTGNDGGIEFHGFQGLTAAATIYDYRAPNGAAAQYRVRRFGVDVVTGTIVISAWTTVSATWTSNDSWLKHPTDPNENIAIRLVSPATGGLTHESADGSFQPLGSDEAVSLTTQLHAEKGTLRVRNDTQAEKDRLERAIKLRVPFLFQTPADDQEPDRWIAMSQWTRTRIIDNADYHKVWEDVDWTEVSEP